MLQLERLRPTQTTRPSPRTAQPPALEMCSREPQLLAELLPGVLARYLLPPAREELAKSRESDYGYARS
jgi:hypothetical protein